MTTEHRIQNEIRNALAGMCILFRANVGKGWTSSLPPFKAPKPMVVSLQPGDVVLRAARPFDTGLPPGFSDTFGSVAVRVTDDMVGQDIAVALYGEIKDADGRLQANQVQFLKAMKAQGARVGVWRSVDDALKTVRGEL